MNHTLEWLLTWGHAPFLFSLMVSGLFMLLQTIFGFSDAIDIETNEELDVDTDMDGEIGSWSISSILGFIGYKKAPLPILFMSVTMWFGVLGLTLSAILKIFVSIPILGNLILGWVIAGSAILSLVITGQVANFINRMLPSDTSTTRPESSRKGDLAVTASTVSDKAGQIELEGRWVAAVVMPGQKSLPKGAVVMIIDHDESHNYIVEPLT